LPHTPPRPSPTTTALPRTRFHRCYGLTLPRTATATLVRATVHCSCCRATFTLHTHYRTSTMLPTAPTLLHYLPTRGSVRCVCPAWHCLRGCALPHHSHRFIRCRLPLRLLVVAAVLVATAALYAAYYAAAARFAATRGFTGNARSCRCLYAYAFWFTVRAVYTRFGWFIGYYRFASTRCHATALVLLPVGLLPGYSHFYYCWILPPATRSRLPLVLGLPRLHTLRFACCLPYIFGFYTFMPGYHAVTLPVYSGTPIALHLYYALPHLRLLTPRCYGSFATHACRGSFGYLATRGSAVADTAHGLLALPSTAAFTVPGYRLPTTLLPACRLYYRYARLVAHTTPVHRSSRLFYYLPPPAHTAFSGSYTLVCIFIRYIYVLVVVFARFAVAWLTARCVGLRAVTATVCGCYIPVTQLRSCGFRTRAVT